MISIYYNVGLILIVSATISSGYCYTVLTGNTENISANKHVCNEWIKQEMLLDSFHTYSEGNQQLED